MAALCPPLGYRWTFVALEYYALILNRVYLVLVGGRTIAGAYMGGPIAARPFPEAAWHPGFWLSEGRLGRYAGLSIESPEFRARHWANFQLPRHEVVSVHYDARPKWGMGTVPYSGRIHIAWRARRREFILLGRQNGPAIRDRLLPVGAAGAVGLEEAVAQPDFDPFRPVPAPGS